MRGSTKKALETATASAVELCKRIARKMMADGAGDAPALGLAWSIAQNAAYDIREELIKTPEGVAFIEQVQRSAAGKRPS